MTERPRVYELKIRGVASDLVRAEFDDVELWEAPGATCLRTGEADIAALYGLIKRIETLGLVSARGSPGRRRRIRRPGPVGNRIGLSPGTAGLEPAEGSWGAAWGPSQ